MPSILDDLGSEVTGIAFPVSLCMALTVALVKLLNPTGESNSDIVQVATTVYDEQEGDSTAKKLSGSLVNGLVFVLIICALTFVLLLLFKYGCMKFLYGYMGFSIFWISFFLTGTLILEVLKKANIHIDYVSAGFILYNFSIVGTMGLVFWPSPLLLQQGYQILTGVAVAYVFTWIPEWTSWVVLTFMAVYDLYAVLGPGGPLKALVEIAIERDQDIPALVYEARPPRGGTRGWAGRRPQNSHGAGQPEEYALASAQAVSVDIGENSTDEYRGLPRLHQDENSPGSSPTTLLRECTERSDQNNFSETPRQMSTNRTSSRPREQNMASIPHQQSEEEDDEFGLPSSLKLGLGDFIFYSVLVGRASFYDLMTVFASYVAIIAGLGMTLLLLAVWRKALPALPFSIALGAAFYFLTRVFLEPFVVPLTTSLAFF